MIKHSFIYSVFMAFVNSWNKSFIKRALFVDFGLEEKYEAGFFGRISKSFANITQKLNAFFSRQIENSRLCGLFKRTLDRIASNEKLTALCGASFFARLAGKAFAFSITELSIFALAFLIPIVPTKIVLALSVAVVALFLANVFITGTIKLRFRLMDLFVLMFFILLTYSVLISYNVKSSAVTVAVYVLFILVYFAVKNTVNTREKLYAVISLIVLSGFLVALYGVYQKLTGNYVATESWIDSDMFEAATFRIYSTLDNPNVLGEYLLFIVPLAFAALYYLKNNLHKLFAVGILGATALCMIYTQSRGAWLGLILALALFALLNDRRLVLLGLIGLILLPLVMPSSIIERFTSIGNMSDSSTSYRVNVWLASLLVIRRFWPIGIGLGTDTFVYIYRMFSFNAGYAFHSHNLYLQLLIDLGIFGLIIFIAYMCCFFKNLFITVGKSGDKFLKAVSAALCAGMAGYLLQGFTDNVWYNYRIVAMFWLILALSGVVHEIARAANGTPRLDGAKTSACSPMRPGAASPTEPLKNIYSQISGIAKKYTAIDKIVLFGSRARKDNDELADIDIAVFASGIEIENKSDFIFEVEEKTDTLLKYDIVFIDDKTDEGLLSEIKKDGVAVYEKS